MKSVCFCLCCVVRLLRERRIKRACWSEKWEESVYGVLVLAYLKPTQVNCRWGQRRLIVAGTKRELIVVYSERRLPYTRVIRV